jgi:predicted dehydrogenase
MMPRHILVIGCGSVGKRHASNLRTLGCRVSGVDPRSDRLAEVAASGHNEGGFTTVAEAMRRRADFDAAVIASPPSLHVEQASACLEAGLPLLLEKPVAPDYESARALHLVAERARVPVLLGYTFRWWDPVRRLRALHEAGTVGRVHRVQMVMAAHLADWHPWERYQDFFMAQAALGGGALLDESHFLDLMVWLFEWPTDLVATVERLSSLEIDTDDNVEVSLALPSGVRVSIHLDLYSRPHERTIRLVGEAGTLEWNNEVNQVRTYRTEQGEWQAETFTCERNDMFVAEARHFLDVLDNAAEPMCTLADGCRVLQLVESIRESSRLRAAVSVPPPHGR